MRFGWDVYRIGSLVEASDATCAYTDCPAFCQACGCSNGYSERNRKRKHPKLGSAHLIWNTRKPQS